MTNGRTQRLATDCCLTEVTVTADVVLLDLQLQWSLDFVCSNCRLKDFFVILHFLSRIERMRSGLLRPMIP